MNTHCQNDIVETRPDVALPTSELLKDKTLQYISTGPFDKFLAPISRASMWYLEAGQDRKQTIKTQMDPASTPHLVPWCVLDAIPITRGVGEKWFWELGSRPPQIDRNALCPTSPRATSGLSVSW